MSVDVKLGGNTITGVSSVKLESATTPGTYEEFKLAGGNTGIGLVIDEIIPDEIVVLPIIIEEEE